MNALLTGLRAAGEPTRLRLLAMCAHGELSVTELTQILRQSQPRVSRHLKLLVEAGLLERFREGAVEKNYLGLAVGDWQLGEQLIDEPLLVAEHLGEAMRIQMADRRAVGKQRHRRICVGFRGFRPRRFLQHRQRRKQ